MTQSHDDAPGPAAPFPRRLLIGVCGSVAVLALPAYLQALRCAGVEQIAAVVTRTAETFLPTTTLRLVCDAVYTDIDPGPGHVALGRWAHDVLLLPATAHQLGCIATGTAPNLVATTVLAAPDPVLLVPAMNPVMWRKPAVQRNVAQLRADGHTVLDPVPGMAYEVASRRIRPSLVMPPPDQLISVLHDRADTAAHLAPPADVAVQP
jgi:phosphopantothenoylcysteine decarboxylase